MYKVFIDGIGQFEFARIPNCQDFVAIDSVLLEIEKVVLFANPKDGESCAAVHVKNPQKNTDSKPRNFGMDTRDRLEKILKKQIGLQNAKTVESSFHGDSWRFKFDVAGQTETYQISTKNERFSRVNA